MNTPILLLVYNRLETVKKVLRVINEVKPKKIYISGDGPKANSRSDEQKVNEVREYVQKNVNEKIEVNTLFHSQNLGSKHAVHKAFRWFFSNEEKGIILEDDCLPANFFFKYCDELLDLYKDDKRIGMITGRNEFGTYENRYNGDYFLSTRAFVWGWATWRDRIEDLDIEIAEKLKMKDMIKIFRHTSTFWEFLYRRKTILDVRDNLVDAWDYQWSVSLLLNSRYTIVPKENMIINIGFGEDATHTNNVSIDPVQFLRGDNEIDHPVELKVDKKYTGDTIKKETGNLWRMLIPRFIINLVRRFI